MAVDKPPLVIIKLVIKQHTLVVLFRPLIISSALAVLKLWIIGSTSARNVAQADPAAAHLFSRLRKGYNIRVGRGGWEGIAMRTKVGIGYHGVASSKSHPPTCPPCQ